MKPIYWAILVAVLVVIAGIFFGVAGIFLAPILGLIAVAALIVWLAERKAHHKPPLE